MASQITSLTIVYSTVHSSAARRKHKSSVSLALVTGEFPAQMASNAEKASIWWRHHAIVKAELNHTFCLAGDGVDPTEHS